ncbi:unnamed protein product [Knipowitschia caucasica]
MEYVLSADDQSKSQPQSTAADTQKECDKPDSYFEHPPENAVSEMRPGDTRAFGDEEKCSIDTDSLLMDDNTHSSQVQTSTTSTERFICCSKSTAKDSEWNYFDSSPAVEPNTCQTGDPTTTCLSTAAPHASSAVETLSGPSVSDFFSDTNSKKSSDVAGLLRSSSHHSESSESDSMPAPLSDLYIFESETSDFALSPDSPGSQVIECSQCAPLTLTAVGEIQLAAESVACESFEVVIKEEENVLEDQTKVESEERDSVSVEPPTADASEAAQENTEVMSMTGRNDSPVELWLDACQFFAVENTQSTYLTESSVTQASIYDTTSDFPISPEETDGSGFSACDVIGWSFDDNKSLGASVERWSSVDSWASALSDWAEIISSPPEDLTAAFSEIGAEIDALTQALAEVTTQIGKEQLSESPKDFLNQSMMGVQDKPLDSHNITETFSEQSCLTSCLGGESSENNGTVAVCTKKMELEEVTRCQIQSKSRSETIQYRTLTSEEQEAAFEEVSSLQDKRCDSFETDDNTEAVLNIVEDTDVERASKSPLENESRTDDEWEVKNESSFSSPDWATTKRIKVAQQENNALGFLHVPEEDGPLDLNAHVFPDSLVDFDGVCQVEPLLGSPMFIMPSAPLSLGSSLVTQASGLNGNQRATRWSLSSDSVYDPNEGSDYQPNSDNITDFSSESIEDITDSKQSETDFTTDLALDEVTQFSFTQSKTIFEESRDLLSLAAIPNDHFTVCAEKKVVCFTLDLFDPFFPLVSTTPRAKMPHKTHKSNSEGKTRAKKDRPPAHCNNNVQTAKKQENLHYNNEAEQQICKENLTENETRLENKDGEQVIDTVVPPKEMGRRHSKKKKKHPNKSTTEPLTQAEPETKTDKATSDVLKDKQVVTSTDQPTALQKNTDKAETKIQVEPKSDKDDLIKKRRLSQGKFGKLVSSMESKLTQGDVKTTKAALDKVDVGATRRKAYSEVVKQNSVKPKQDLKVVKPIQAVSVSGDPQSMCLWCQFSDVLTDYTVTWRRDSTVLNEVKRSAGDESRVSLTISNASHKDLGKYQCELKNTHGKVVLDFLLTYELLSEIVVPATPKVTPAVSVEVDHEEEDILCSRLMFKQDFLTEQTFGDSHSASIMTEKTHFGEGMHRRAFRTTLQAGQVPLLLPGHSCVLKVHNSISYGTNNNDELVQKNFNLAVEECQVQNTAREFIKAYTTVAQSFEAFGPVPEIIPIFLVHRPSNDIPYATLEEELFGDFVKYSVKDGKEINLMRKDSEAGQKCCAFQHWVYQNTEGNLLVTDMQGVGMRLTDVGIATCKKGYKGFKGNCATSFIDQFKALHQCNEYCEILGLVSLQSKPKKTMAAPKSKAQAGAIPKKKTFEFSLKGKS